MRLLFAAAAAGLLAAAAPAQKGAEVELAGMKATTPADWKEEAQKAGSMRMHTFKLPNNAASGVLKRNMTEVVWCNFPTNETAHVRVQRSALPA